MAPAAGNSTAVGWPVVTGGGAAWGEPSTGPSHNALTQPEIEKLLLEEL